NGILIKGGEFIEIPATLKAIAFEKTGTLTLGQPTITEIFVAETCSEQYLISIAASLESSVDHPIAKADLDYATNDNIVFTPASNSQVIIGKGVTGEIDNNRFCAQK
ncbi:HAD family hydrolase, partial [Francisella tularensis subsp. holarctica]|uniref:HAD family hydrolase n=1 Tax=Francisella tularensis TaxID=263 RepID=UPI002381B679